MILILLGAALLLYLFARWNDRREERANAWMDRVRDLGRES